jgi:hypothetical protein
MRELGLVAVLGLGLVACGKGGGAPKVDPQPPAPAPVAAAPVPVPVPVPDPAPPVAPAAPAKPGADLTADARALYRMVACGSGDAIADAEKAKVVDRHCKWITERLADYRSKYVVGGRAFFDEIEPDDIPRTVVYPFGGGDLISALVAFSEADEITTISLELAGDPTRVGTLTARQLEGSLASLRGDLGGTLSVGSNTSENLSASQRNHLPAQVSSFLLGLAANGFEPVGMRYIRLEDDGSIHYLTEEEIVETETETAAARKGTWHDPNFAEGFAHVEIEYRKAGDPTDRVRVHRHFGWNLGDGELAKHPQLIKHLEQKGKVTVLVKGASYLLWRNDFATIRNYLLGHLAWMLSDSTGIPPMYARKANMVQDTYGRFAGAFLEGAGGRHSEDFRALWAKNKKRKLPFRFGYVDSEKNAHLVVTRPLQPPAGAAAP